ncbi:MAG: immunity 26/phosphotriesterase HocA family protein [Polyangiaceae bacterium]|nr:immunity 26/phosphotriesterase HocA family protein [Polyangiaceae bacterium]
MKHGKLPALGTAFLVPLRDGGFALGVLARADKKGSAFGYFFGPRVSSAAEVRLDRVVPEDALLVGMFGDLEIIRGNWPIIGKIDTWSPDRWSMPPYRGSTRMLAEPGCRRMTTRCNASPRWKSIPSMPTAIRMID